TLCYLLHGGARKATWFGRARRPCPAQGVREAVAEVDVDRCAEVLDRGLDLGKRTELDHPPTLARRPPAARASASAATAGATGSRQSPRSPRSRASPARRSRCRAS